MPIELISHSPDQTHAVGERLANFFLDHETTLKNLGAFTIALEGDLGSGKTFLSRSIIQTLGTVLQPNQELIVNSPTYCLLNHYPLRIPVTHVDCYRLSNLYELENIGIRDYLQNNGIMLVEWASKVEDFLPNPLMKIEISTNLQKRALKFSLSAYNGLLKMQLKTCLKQLKL